MAPKRLPAILEVEVTAVGPTFDSGRYSCVDPPHGRGQHHWGAERIANEFQGKVGIRLSPSTVRKYMVRQRGPCRGDSQQRWSAFLRNHAQAIIACDFFTVVTAGFRILYVFVVMDLDRRQVLHFNVTGHPTAEWTLQQLREALPGGHP